MKTIYRIALIVILAGFVSCKKWLDVKPKTQIESSVNFENEQGFKDALTGVYISMSQPAAYGKELSYGFVEVLGKNYTQFSVLHDYLEDSNYNYEFSATKSRIDEIWKKGYYTIANLNNLIENLDKADPSLFTGTNYGVIKGEAYGLRAFNHFDLLRLFAPAPGSGGASATAIPYRTKLTSNTVPLSTVSAFIVQLLSDLKVAADLLKGADPIFKGSAVPATNTGYLRDRPFKFNYYAVKALMARVYLYNGDKTNALACAREVIESDAFPATPDYLIADGNRILSTEVIFNINLLNLADLYNFSYSPVSGTGMYLADSEWETIYETNNGGTADYRWNYQTAVFTNNNRYSVKFNPLLNTSTAAANRLPLMRVSELYYIAAECLAGTDPEAAVGYLNTVRQSRNLTTDLDATLTADQIQEEIFKEYRKDFITEGQLFFYYKRLNLSKIEFTQIPGSKAVYVLPVPDQEIEYGTIK